MSKFHFSKCWFESTPNVDFTPSIIGPFGPSWNYFLAPPLRPGEPEPYRIYLSGSLHQSRRVCGHSRPNSRGMMTNDSLPQIEQGPVLVSNQASGPRNNQCPAVAIKNLAACPRGPLNLRKKGKMNYTVRRDTNTNIHVFKFFKLT